MSLQDEYFRLLAARGMPQRSASVEDEEGAVTETLPQRRRQVVAGDPPAPPRTQTPPMVRVGRRSATDELTASRAEERRVQEELRQMGREESDSRFSLPRVRRIEQQRRDYDQDTSPAAYQLGEDEYVERRAARRGGGENAPFPVELGMRFIAPAYDPINPVRERGVGRSNLEHSGEGQRRFWTRVGDWVNHDSIATPSYLEHRYRRPQTSEEVAQLYSPTMDEIVVTAEAPSLGRRIRAQTDDIISGTRNAGNVIAREYGAFRARHPDRDIVEAVGEEGMEFLVSPWVNYEQTAQERDRANYRSQYDEAAEAALRGHGEAALAAATVLPEVGGLVRGGRAGTQAAEAGLRGVRDTIGEVGIRRVGEPPLQAQLAEDSATPSLQPSARPPRRVGQPIETPYEVAPASEDALYAQRVDEPAPPPETAPITLSPEAQAAGGARSEQEFQRRLNRRRPDGIYSQGDDAVPPEQARRIGQPRDSSVQREPDAGTPGGRLPLEGEVMPPGRELTAPPRAPARWEDLTPEQQRGTLAAGLTDVGVAVERQIADIDQVLAAPRIDRVPGGGFQITDSATGRVLREFEPGTSFPEVNAAWREIDNLRLEQRASSPTLESSPRASGGENVGGEAHQPIDMQSLARWQQQQRQSAFEASQAGPPRSIGGGWRLQEQGDGSRIYSRANVTVEISPTTLSNGEAGGSISWGLERTPDGRLARGKAGVEAMQRVEEIVLRDARERGLAEYTFTAMEGPGQARRYERLMEQAERYGYTGNVNADGIFTLTRRAANPAPRVPDGGSAGPIRAFHGSPHDFDRFDIARVGTGEGQQMQGHGLYFGGARGTGESYVESVGRRHPRVEGKPFDENNPRHVAAGALADYVQRHGRANRMDIVDELYRRIHRLPRGPEKRTLNQAVLELNEHFRSGVRLPQVESAQGNLYEVDLNLQPERLIDMGHSLADQPPSVREAFVRLLPDEDLTGFHVEDAYLALADRLGSKRAASDALYADGVQGVRYLDAGSRGAGDGTYNYVTFSDADVSIVSKNGQEIPRTQLPNGGSRGGGPRGGTEITANEPPSPARRIGRRDDTSSTLATAGTVLGATLLAPDEAEAQSADMATTQARVRELEANAQRFAPGNLNRSDRAEVRAAQEFLQSQGLYLQDSQGRPVVPDGVWGDGMTLAVRQYLETNSDELEFARTSLGELEQAQMLEANSAGPLREGAREIGPWIATAAGAWLGHRSRIGAVRRADAQLAERNARADSLLTPGPVRRGRSAADRAEPLRRAANINQFWREGGAERVPFSTTQSGRGFGRRIGSADPSTLYPPEATSFRGNDVGAIGAGAGEAALSGGGWYLAQVELEDAQAAYDADPSEANLRRLERARDMLAVAQAFTRGGLGFAAGRLGGTVTHRYSNARPNIAAAEAERFALDQSVTPARAPRRRVGRERPSQ